MTQCLTPTFVAFLFCEKLLQFFVLLMRVIIFAPLSPQNRFKGPKAMRFISLLSTFLPKAKKEDSFFNESLVAEMGFEPHDLRVMSPTSCQTAPLRDIWCRKPGSNRYEKKSHGILSPGRLPIPPFRHERPCGLPHCLYIIAPKNTKVNTFFEKNLKNFSTIY